MNKVPDRKKLRQEYLRRKAEAYTSGTVAGTLLIPCLLITVVCYGASIWILFVTISSLFQPGGFSIVALFVFVVYAVVSVILSLFTAAFYVVARDAKRLIAKTPYIPPVTPDTLPAEEILVRGSEEPPFAQNEMLLRAVQQGQETPKEELLRVAKE